MVRRLAAAAGLLACVTAAPHAARQSGVPALGSLRLPLSIPDTTTAVGLHRADASTFPIDIVRFAFASPDGSNAAETKARAALAAALARTGTGDLVPLPLSPDTWRARVLRSSVPDDRLAAAIFAQRRTALLYHALLGLDVETVAWIDHHPETIDAFLKHPGTAAIYARSLHVRGGRVQTPGDDAADVWQALVGADPAQPAAFADKLLAARAGRVAQFYDAVAHADRARQAFVLGRPGDRARVDRARRTMDAITRTGTPWSVDDHPFLRPDVDLSVILRAIAVADTGVLHPPASRALWSRVFREPAAGDGDIDAEWLTHALLDVPAVTARRRLETFAFAQRAFAEAPVDGDLVFALQQHPRATTLLSTLVELGIVDAATHASAIRAASSLEGHDDEMVVFQSALAIVARARSVETLSNETARDAALSLVRAAGARNARAALLAWVDTDLSRIVSAPGPGRPDLEMRVLSALAGPSPSTPRLVRWEGQDYVADLGRAELRRLTRARKAQDELSLDAALEASRGRSIAPLAHSMAAIVYALAIGEPDDGPLNGGPVWRRHRFGGDGPGQEPNAFAWRVGTEVFGAAGWHLTGSLLYLHVALAHLSLRRLDESDMPAPSQLSTNDRRIAAMSVALMEPRRLTDAQRDGIAMAIARGRERASSLPANPRAIEDADLAATLGEWRATGVRWLATAEPAATLNAFTLHEIYRLGGGTPLDDWGAASAALDGCLCLRLPRESWEGSVGRPSTGQLGTHFVDVALRTAVALADRHLPAALARDVAAFAARDALDRASPAWAGDWLSVAFTARDLPNDRFDDYVAALTAIGPLMPPPRGSQ